MTRQRDLTVFEFASVRDVRLADCGDGLTFAVFGVVPERRLLLESRLRLPDDSRTASRSATSS